MASLPHSGVSYLYFIRLELVGVCFCLRSLVCAGRACCVETLYMYEYLSHTCTVPSCTMSIHGTSSIYEYEYDCNGGVAQFRALR